MGVSSSQGAVEWLKALRGEEDRESEVEGGGDQTDGGGWPLKYTEECTIPKHLTCL